MKRLMVVSPHADDAELGCGGYMARTVEEGGEVMNIVVAVGRVYFGHLGREVSAEERVDECRASMRTLGVQHCEVLYRSHDSLLDRMPVARIVHALDGLQSAFQPTEILMPLPSSHQDHVTVYRACLAATRPSSFNTSLTLIAAYEYPATSWGEGASADAGRGGMYVGIGDFLGRKLEALDQYKTQIRPDGHCWSIEAARAMAKLRGLESGLGCAELFHTMRLVVR